MVALIFKGVIPDPWKQNVKKDANSHPYVLFGIFKFWRLV